jgi:hypothetical protein
MQENIGKIKGTMEAVLVKPNGEKQVVNVDNLILNAGFDFICAAMGAASQPAAMRYIAIGTGVTAPAATQTALVTEVGRVLGTYSHTNGTKVWSVSATFNAGVGTGAITEAGVCNAASSGTFLDRVTFAVINKEANDVLTVTFTFTLSEV